MRGVEVDWYQVIDECDLMSALLEHLVTVS